MADPSIRIETVYLRHEKVPQALQDQLSAAESEHPQLGLSWLLNLVQHALEPDETPVLLVAWGPQGSVCLLPVIFRSGGTINALTTFYTSLYQPVGTLPECAPLLSALLRHLRATSDVSALTLAPMDPSNAMFLALKTALAEAGWRGCHDYFCFGNWRQHLGAANWDAYLGSRPSRVRNTVDRKTRRFLRDGNGTLQIIRPGEPLETAISNYTHIYEKSWKRDEPYPEFIPNLMRIAADKGWLRLGFAHYNGEPIASQLWLVHKGTAYIYKLAYDQDYAQQSPGTVLTAYMMEDIINSDGVTSIDYLSGDDSYKRDWMSERREMRGLAAFNPATAGGLIDLLKYRFKQGLKRLRNARTPHNED